MHILKCHKFQSVVNVPFYYSYFCPTYSFRFPNLILVLYTCVKSYFSTCLCCTACATSGGLAAYWTMFSLIHRSSTSSRERRSRSRDRDRDREKRSSRHRSRSREREYHDRSRDRHYDTDRHRDRDRDRDREYRSRH